jgi:CHASE3 domain sensor protein
MDPLTIFAGVKAGIAAGKEIASLAKDLGSLFDAIDSAKSNHEKKKSSPFSSANEEALDTFVKRKQADDIEEQLRQIVISTRGFSAWNELLALRKDIRVQRKKDLAAKKKKQEELFDQIILWGCILLLVILTAGFGLLGLMYYMDKL